MRRKPVPAHWEFFLLFYSFTFLPFKIAFLLFSLFIFPPMMVAVNGNVALPVSVNHGGRGRDGVCRLNDC